MIGIYKITSPNNRIYIGQSRNIEKRFSAYKSSGAKGQIKLRNSFLKYGWENHKFEIVEECDLLELNKREHYWGHFYDSIKSGLNLELPNPDKLPAKSRDFTDEHKKNLSLSETGEKNHQYGKRSIEAPASKTIQCSETGQIFYTLLECAKYCGYSYTHLSMMLNDRRPNNTTYKYITKQKFEGSSI